MQMTVAIFIYFKNNKMRKIPENFDYLLLITFLRMFVLVHGVVGLRLVLSGGLRNVEFNFPLDLAIGFILSLFINLFCYFKKRKKQIKQSKDVPGLEEFLE